MRYALCLVGLLLFHKQAVAALQGSVDILLGAAAHLREQSARGLTGVVGWLGRSAVSEPKRVLVGLTLLFLAGLIAYADYIVLTASIGLIWPTDLSPRWLALSMVVVTVAAGILVHSTTGLLPRALVAALAVVLVGAQGTIAYLRTVQLSEIRGMTEAATAALPKDGTLIVAGQESDGAEATAKGPSEITPLPEALAPLMAASMAVLLCLGEIGAVWGGLSFAGAALTWILCFPVMSALAGSSITLRLISDTQTKDALTRILSALAEACDAFWAFVGQAVNEMLPFPFTENSLRRRLDRLRRVHSVQLRRLELDLAEKVLASSDEEIRKVEEQSVHEFLEEYAKHRRTVYRSVLDRALNSAKFEICLPGYVAQMWFWPLKKMGRLCVLLGEADGRLPLRDTNGLAVGVTDEKAGV